MPPAGREPRLAMYDPFVNSPPVAPAAARGGQFRIFAISLGRMKDASGGPGAPAGDVRSFRQFAAGRTGRCPRRAISYLRNLIAISRCDGIN
jgi:hypothetical protein